jgi:hypothetical protein
VHYNAVIKKLREICVDPGRYKNLNYPLQNLKLVHIGTHFVLLFFFLLCAILTEASKP